MPALERRNPLNLGHQVRQRRDVEVALEQRRLNTDLFVGKVEQVPYRVDNIGPVCINQQVVAFVVVPRHVHVDDALCRDAAQKGARIVAVVDAVDVDVVDVEVQPAIGFIHNGIDEFEFAHFVDGCHSKQFDALLSNDNSYHLDFETQLRALAFALNHNQRRR